MLRSFSAHKKDLNNCLLGIEISVIQVKNAHVRNNTVQTVNLLFCNNVIDYRSLYTWSGVQISPSPIEFLIGERLRERFYSVSV